MTSFVKRCFGFIFAPGHRVTTEWLNVYCKDAVKNIQNILPWQGQPPQKAAEQLSVVGGRDFVVIDAIYKRGTTPWFFRGPGWVMHADAPCHCRIVATALSRGLGTRNDVVRVEMIITSPHYHIS